MVQKNNIDHDITKYDKITTDVEQIVNIANNLGQKKYPNIDVNEVLKFIREKNVGHFPNETGKFEIFITIKDKIIFNVKKTTIKTNCNLTYSGMRWILEDFFKNIKTETSEIVETIFPEKYKPVNTIKSKTKLAETEKFENVILKRLNSGPNVFKEKDRTISMTERLRTHEDKSHLITYDVNIFHETEKTNQTFIILLIPGLKTKIHIFAKIDNFIYDFYKDYDGETIVKNNAENRVKLILSDYENNNESFSKRLINDDTLISVFMLTTVSTDNEDLNETVK